MKGCLNVVGIIFLLFVIMFVLASVFDTGEEDKPDKIGAFLYAEKAVENHLKAPSSAEFASYNNSLVTQDQDTFYVQSYVDSQNSFGAMVRSNFEVRVIFVDEKIQTRILKFEQR